MSNKGKPRKNYEVGYGKPPVSGRFKPGHSGNPKGRPKGRKSCETIIDDMLNKKLKVRVGNETQTLSQIEAIIMRIVNDALQGKSRAIDQLFKMMATVSSQSDETSEATPEVGYDPEDDQETLRKYWEINRPQAHAIEGDENDE